MPILQYTTPYQVITDRILTLLEQGTVPWHKPWDSAMGLPRNPSDTRPVNGIRLGVQELTRLGMSSDEMDHVADLLARAATDSAMEAVKREVHELVGSFPTVYYCFDHPYPPHASSPNTSPSAPPKV